LQLMHAFANRLRDVAHRIDIIRTATLCDNPLPEGGAIMARKYIDCRDHPSDVKCTVALSADSEEELMAAVVQHAKTVHKYEITPEFQDMIRKGMKAGSPPA